MFFSGQSLYHSTLSPMPTNRPVPVSIPCPFLPTSSFFPSSKLKNFTLYFFSISSPLFSFSFLCYLFTQCFFFFSSPSTLPHHWPVMLASGRPIGQEDSLVMYCPTNQDCGFHRNREESSRIE